MPTKLFSALAVILFLVPQSWGLTVKDLVVIQGEQENEISGQGLVVGLQGSGDKKNPLKDSMLREWMHNSDLDVPQANFESKNVALVNVSVGSVIEAEHHGAMHQPCNQSAPATPNTTLRQVEYRV